MSPGPTFDRVYLALKEQLMGGAFAPGDHLEPVAIGLDLNASITPVRDALHRLVGERIVEAPRHDGFRVPAPTEAELRDLYAWNGDLLALALRATAGAGARAPQLAAAAGGNWDAADLFRQLARGHGNPQLEAAVDNLSDRLAAFRLAEKLVFEDHDEELLALRELAAAGDRIALRRGLGAYHRRRRRAVSELILACRPRRDRP